MMELLAAAESEAVNLPGWFAWMMVIIALAAPAVFLRLVRRPTAAPVRPIVEPKLTPFLPIL